MKVMNIVIGGMQEHQSVKTDGIHLLMFFYGHRGRIYSFNCNSCMKKKFYLYDDYNSKVNESNKIIGTVIPTFGHTAFRNGWKLIIKEINMTAESRKQKAESRKQKIIPVAINYVKTGNLLTVAICLQARDYKGFNTGSQLMNGVIIKR